MVRLLRKMLMNRSMIGTQQNKTRQQVNSDVLERADNRKELAVNSKINFICN